MKLRCILLTGLLLACDRAPAADLGKGLQAFHEGDFATALAECRPLAEHGNASAQFVIGVMYFEGRGVPKDPAKGAQWTLKAADQGVADAQFNLAMMYTKGQGVPQDDAQAATWLRKAADQGVREAQYNLATFYLEGKGVARDFNQAFEWNRKAAEAGSADAQFNLAMMYERGEGVAQDDAQALAWYRRIATKDEPGVLLHMAAMIEAGRGAPPDRAAAWALVALAASGRGGDAHLDEERDALASSMSSAERERGKDLLRDMQQMGVMEALGKTTTRANGDMPH